MTYFMALIIALSALFYTPTQAPSQAPLSPLSQAPITAPSQALTYEAPKVGTVPAPQAPATKAPAPVATTPAPLKAPVQAPTAAPICHEDMPCWDCTTMGNLICGNASPQVPVAPVAPVEAPVVPAAPLVDPYSGNPIVDCAAQGLITAEDYSCVSPSFYGPIKGYTPTDNPVIPDHAEPGI